MSVAQMFKLLKRGSLSDYSKIRRLKVLFYPPYLVNQMNPKNFVIGLADLDFTFLDFFMSPYIEDKEVYLENLFERLFEGLKSEDSLFFKAAKHFIERIIRYALWYVTPQEKNLRRIPNATHSPIRPETQKSNIVSIKSLLERYYENMGENVVFNNSYVSEIFGPYYDRMKDQLDLKENGGDRPAFQTLDF